jgi:hypothetical protein
MSNKLLLREDVIKFLIFCGENFPFIGQEYTFRVML